MDISVKDVLCDRDTWIKIGNTERSADLAVEKMTKFFKTQEQDILYLYNLGLIELPVEIGMLTTLTEFYCVNNKLRELPAEIGCLTALTLLDCGSNELIELPAEIGYLTALTFINCIDNKLKEFPYEIGCLTALTKLACNHNELTPIEGINMYTNRDILEYYRQQWKDMCARSIKSANKR